MKTTLEKIKQSSTAAQIFSGICALGMLIYGIAKIIDSTDIVSTATTVTNCFSMAVIFLAAMLMFRKISVSGKPFSAESVKLLRVIALVFMIGAVLSSAVTAVALAVTNAEEISVSLDAGAIFLGALLLILAQIFKYGTILQQESDETL